MTEQIEKIKKEVLKEWFGTEDLRWADSCPEDEIGKEDVHGVVELTIQKTAREIFKDLREHEARDLNGNPTGDIILQKDEFEKLKKKWGVGDVDK